MRSVALIVAAGLVVGLHAATARAATADVAIQDLAFQPASLTIQAGDGARWTNKDPISHTVTSDADLFDSGALGPGGQFAHTFNAAGTFAYHCSIHPEMTGTVKVIAAGPGLSIGDVSLTEGDYGSRAAAFRVTLSKASAKQVTVAYRTVAGAAEDGVDYEGRQGTLVFAPGDVERTVSVPVLGDVLDERRETFAVGLSSPTNAAVVDGEALGTIIDDDPPPSITIRDVVKLERNEGLHGASFAVRLSVVSGRRVTVHYATADGTATAPSDYVAASGTLVITAGRRGRRIVVQVRGDRRPEGRETFFVDLSRPVHGALADRRGRGTIVDFD